MADDVFENALTQAVKKRKRRKCDCPHCKIEGELQRLVDEWVESIGKELEEAISAEDDPEQKEQMIAAKEVYMEGIVEGYRLGFFRSRPSEEMQR